MWYCQSWHSKNLPHAVVKQKVKKNPQKVIAFLDKTMHYYVLDEKNRSLVTVLTTIHEAVMVEMGKVDREENKIEKPEAIDYCCGWMGGTDLNDQLLNYYTFLQKSLKWSKKLLIHLFNMVILNAHILNKCYGSKKLSHDAFRDRLIKVFNWGGSESLTIFL